jgi:hypothetical protein
MSEDPCEEVVTSIIGSWREQGIPLNPDWIAAEAMKKEIDPELIYSPVAREGLRFHCRHIACGILGIDDAPKSPAEAMKQMEQLRAASAAFSEHAAAPAEWESKRPKRT